MRKYLDSTIIFETKDMEHTKWLDLRKTGIGGSDAASVLGLNPYKSSMSVYLEKASLDNEKIHIDKSYDDNKTNYKMQLGNKLEEFVAKEFSLKTGKKVRNINGILKNDKYPFAIANIDRAVVGERAFLECKVCGSYSKKVWEVGVPIYTQIQVNHYMAVTGATHCYVAVLVGNEELYIHNIKRDEEIIDEIMKHEDMFWNNYILGQDIPQPDGSCDYSKYLQNHYRDSIDEKIILYEQESVLNRYDEINILSKEIDTEKKKIEQHIQNQMQKSDIAYIGDRKITWKKQERNTIDTKRLKKELPDIAKEYIKTTTSRVFKIL